MAMFEQWRTNGFGRGWRWWQGVLPAMAVMVFAPAALAADGSMSSLSDTAITWPSFRDVVHVLLLRDYNTRLVVLSTALLGLAAGLIGTFLLLRKRSLIGDALSHATLPGIATAFIVMVAFGGEGKSLPGLLAGAAVFGLLGVFCVQAIARWTRLKDDTAMGIVLSVFFGIGVALLGLVQSMPEGSAAGLEYFIYGKTASMVASDFTLIASVGAVVVLACGLLFKELAMICFDEAYAGAQGWPVARLDAVMLLLVTAVTVIGLQAVGLILVIAMLIIPPAAARFWTDHLLKMVLLAAAIGMVCGWLGASVSALMYKLPAGAVIVVVGAAVFVFSMIFGTARGVLVRAVQHWLLVEKVGRQNLLRAIYELLEMQPGGGQLDGPRAVSRERLLGMRSWSAVRLAWLVRRARHAGLLRPNGRLQCMVTDKGLREAARVVRNHRLWELYLITHADIATSHVDRDADQIEHVLGTEMVERLETLLHGQKKQPMPASAHGITPPDGRADR